MLIILSIFLIVIAASVALIRRRDGVPFFGALIVSAIVFGELSAYVGSFEEKAVFILLLAFALLKIINLKNSDFHIFFPCGFDRSLAIIFLVYMLAQSFRSIIFFPRGLGSAFWPLFFLALLFLVKVSNASGRLRDDHSRDRVIKTSRLLLISVTANLLLIVLSHWALKLNLVAEVPQLPHKSTTLFAVTCLAPLFVIHYAFDNRFWRRIAALTAVLSIIAAVLISSRATLVPLLIFCLFALLMTRERRRVLFSAFIGIALLVVAAVISPSLYNDGVQTIFDTFQVFSADEAQSTTRDMDRIVHYLATFEVWKSDLGVLLFGVGFRASGYYLASLLADYYQSLFPGLDFETELGGYSDVYTFGWNGILLDLGVVGLLIVVWCVWRSVRYVISNATGIFRVLLVFAILVLVIRLFTNSFSGSTLFYYMVLPGFMVRFFISAGRSFELVSARGASSGK